MASLDWIHRYREYLEPAVGKPVQDMPIQVKSKEDCLSKQSPARETVHVLGTRPVA